MSEQVRTVAEQIGDPYSVRFGIVGTIRVGTFSVTGTIRHDQLPSALGKDLLIREVFLAADGRSLRATVNQDNPWTRLAPARDVNRSRAAHIAFTLFLTAPILSTSPGMMS